MAAAVLVMAAVRSWPAGRSCEDCAFGAAIGPVETPLGTRLDPAPERTATRADHGPLALLPLENYSGSSAPLSEIRLALIEKLRAHGLRIVVDDALDAFMARHRIRYTAGLSADLAAAFRSEVGAGTVLVTSLDQFETTDPPKIALTARLVATGESASIVWMGAVHLAGDERPGLFGLSTISDPELLTDKAVLRLADALALFLSGNSSALRGGRVSSAERSRRFRAKRMRRSAGAVSPTSRIAVLPFANESTRQDAGEILALHFVRQLVRLPGLEIVEPGTVRESLLQSRLIMEGGLSVPQADLLRTLLDVDLVIVGSVTEYQDYAGSAGRPVVVFSAQGIDTKTRQLAWTSMSYNQGDDGVFFFGRGRIHTAHELASAMIYQVISRLYQPPK